VSVGDICWIRLTEELRRQAVVLQSYGVSTSLPTVLVVPLTSDVEALRLPGTVPIEPDQENGLTRSVVALVFHLTAVDARLLEMSTGRISAGTLNTIWSELDRLTGRGAE
jgi:mRNA-degrading endonuclease toxin of MazEF toxin-antitoxin module